MKSARFWLLLGMLIPCASFGANTSAFQSAAQLLSAARRGDTRTIQFLVNSGADINYVDSSGLSVVCTAVMNNDKRAIQILQMYGADASNCDKQIKQYKRKTRVAAQGEEYDFFSGLSSSHVVALSAVGVAAVIGGVALLTNVFDSKSHNDQSSSGGSRPGGGGSSDSSSASLYFTVPYGPEYLTNGVVDKNKDISGKLDFAGEGIVYKNDFDYLINGDSDADGLNPELENYLLTMGGYYGFANGYVGNYIFRDSKTNAPVAVERYEDRPVRVALITGNGINPAGSADSAGGIWYASDVTLGSTKHMPKYLNNGETQNPDYTYTVYEDADYYDLYDLSGSGSVFNPFADVNDSALAKIVAGWEEGGRSEADLYGFVPNGSLAIYRTGNGMYWQATSEEHTNVGTFSDSVTGSGLSAGDTITLNSTAGVSGTFTIYNALDYEGTSVMDPTVTINGTTYQLASASKMFIAKCETGCTSDIAIYVGVDGKWYVNYSGGHDIDAVYAVDSTNNIYIAKTQVPAAYKNFTAMTNAKKNLLYRFDGDTTSATVDVIANVNVIPASRQRDYVTLGTFVKSAEFANSSNNLSTHYQNLINDNYGSGEGAVANTLFNSFSLATEKSNNNPMLIMPAGDYLFAHKETSGDLTFYYDTLDATFENYAPLLTYGNNLKHNFMTIVGVAHESGTTAYSTIQSYGDGNNSDNKIHLAVWNDDENVYSSRMCGIAGVGKAADSVDPWCFAASGPTAEMATASAAGAVAAVKAAFSYMTNDQIFTLLALTADGPYLGSKDSGTAFTADTLAAYLQDMYLIPTELLPYGQDALSSAEYLDLFKRVYGYGLINVRRAIKPSFSVYRYDATTNSIVSVKGKMNGFWGTGGKNPSRASTVFGLTGRGSVTTAFYDILESSDGSLSLPRVWKSTIALGDNDKHGLYMGDVLGDFNVDSTNKHSNQVGNLVVDMSMSARAYDDNMNGLDNMRIAWTNDKFDLATEYQRHLTDGESRFNGRANGVLGLVSNTMSANTMYKSGRFGFGGRAFVGAITDENLLDQDPVVASQSEPCRLGLANGASFDTKFADDKFGLNVSVGVMRENNTVLGMVSEGTLAMNNADTKYIDALATYKPFDNVKLSLRGTFATTHADSQSEFIASLSDIKSNAFAFGADVGNFSFTAALPLAVIDGQLGYGYADFDVVENNGKYEIAVNNPHMEYIDLSAAKRELRFSTSYKHALGEWTDAGVGLIYRLHPNNTDVFGNESILMFKIHHRLGI